MEKGEKDQTASFDDDIKSVMTLLDNCGCLDIMSVHEKRMLKYYLRQIYMNALHDTNNAVANIIRQMRMDIEEKK